HEHVDAAVGQAGLDAGGNVAVRDELDAGAGGAHVLEQLVVPGAVQHDHGDLADGLVEGFGDAGEVFGDGSVDVDDVLGGRAHGDLVHVEDFARHVHGASGGHGDDGDGAGQALGEQGCAVDGVYGDIHLGVGAVADVLAVVEHGRFVLLALADDDDA